MRRWMIAAGLVGFMIGMGFVSPAVAQVRNHGVLPADGIAFLSLGVLLCFGGIGSFVYGVKGPHA